VREKKGGGEVFMATKEGSFPLRKKRKLKHTGVLGFKIRLRWGGGTNFQALQKEKKLTMARVGKKKYSWGFTPGGEGKGEAFYLKLAQGKKKGKVRVFQIGKKGKIPTPFPRKKRQALSTGEKKGGRRRNKPKVLPVWGKKGVTRV